MEPVSRRAFIAGTGAVTVAGLSVVGSSLPAVAGDVRAPKTGGFRHVGDHPLYSLGFFRNGKKGTWKAGGMRLSLEKLMPITTGDGKVRLHEGAFEAVFDLESGAHQGSGTYDVVAPDGTKFPLHLTRAHHQQGKGTRYVAVINRWVPEA